MPVGGILWVKEILAFFSPGKSVSILVFGFIKCVWEGGEKEEKNLLISKQLPDRDLVNTYDPQGTTLHPLDSTPILLFR